MTPALPATPLRRRFHIALALLDWGACADSANCPADLDYDGNVGAGDIALFLLLFGDPV